MTEQQEQQCLTPCKYCGRSRILILSPVLQEQVDRKIVYARPGEKILEAIEAHLSIQHPGPGHFPQAITECSFRLPECNLSLLIAISKGFRILNLTEDRIKTIFSLSLPCLQTTAMNFEKAIKPISYLKSHTAEIFRNLEKNRLPLIVTQNGEARAVVQDIASYEATQESLALLKIIAQSKISIEQGKSKPARKAFADMRQKIKSA
jgi:prevent-host-death family protein